jgi:hypothetical protein
VDDPERARCVGCLTGCREERALRRSLALAAVGDFEPALHGLGAREHLVDLAELAARERADLVAHAGGAVGGSHQILDLLQLEARALRHADERQPREHVLVIAPLAVEAVGLGKHPDRLVIADRRRGDAGLASHLSDGELRRVVHSFDSAA